MFNDKSYELELLTKIDGSASQSYYVHDNAFDAETQADKKMAGDINTEANRTICNMVVNADGSIPCKEFFSKVPIGGEDYIKYWLFYVETYNDGTEDSILLSKKDTLQDAVALYYNKKGASRDKANLETAMGKVINSHGGVESGYDFALDTNPPEPEPPIEEVG